MGAEEAGGRMREETMRRRIETDPARPMVVLSLAFLPCQAAERGEGWTPVTLIPTNRAAFFHTL